MITQEVFKHALKSTGRLPNKGQAQAVFAAAGDPLFIVAGPGTGKTASLTMRMLKLMLVDGISPGCILATTFTKKAAAELRSRLLMWGYAVIEHLQAHEKLTRLARLWLERMDINQVHTGTIDSICEELLREHRDPGTDPPILADEFVSETLLLRAGLFNAKRYLDDDLDAFLCETRGTGRWGWRIGAKNDLVLQMWDRRHQDQMAWTAYAASGRKKAEKNALTLLDAAMADYAAELQDRLMVDFAQLEQTVLDRLRKGGFKEFTNELKVVLVDEYQDTNLIQDSIYFELAKCCNGALTVVGDDDQSLYRFRGATVDLFSDFEARYHRVFKRTPIKVFLNENYRSTQSIITFVNSYATLDKSYQSIRVAGKPPLVNPVAGSSSIPVLGMFRDSVDELAEDLAGFINRVTRGPGFKLPSGDVIKVDKAKGGDVGDVALLCSSPREYSAGNESRLPLLLKEELAASTPAIPVFNPRGQDFSSISQVRRLGGLLLCCLDRNGDAEDIVVKALGKDIQEEFQQWATETETWLRSGKAQKELVDFVNNWSKRNPGRPKHAWPKSTPAIDLLYALVHWMPVLYDDPEGQIYLEVFTRQLAACEQVSGYKARVISDATKKDQSLRSVGHLLQYFLAPIASGAVSVDEELIESFPRDRLSVLSIHQSKGLEFPLVIVDVGSDFRRNHHGHAFKRCPVRPSTPHILEDLMRPFSPLKAPKRSGVDRAFDDLYRQFFVAFSRPQDVLLLVGLTAGLPPDGDVENVAMGYDRDGKCHWGSKKPFLEI
jgi:DNA helicase-2/ATP-dependent DNA helicase PcrA